MRTKFRPFRLLSLLVPALLGAGTTAFMLVGCQKEAPVGADRPEAVAKVIPPPPCNLLIACSYNNIAVTGMRAVNATNPSIILNFIANGNGVFTLSPVPAGQWFLEVQVNGTFGSLTSTFDNECYPGGSGTHWYNVMDAPLTLPCGGYKIYFSDVHC